MRTRHDGCIIDAAVWTLGSRSYGNTVTALLRPAQADAVGKGDMAELYTGAVSLDVSCPIHDKSRLCIARVMYCYCGSSCGALPSREAIEHR
jgi:hypothetical protein